MEGRALLRNTDTLALQILQAFYAGVIVVGGYKQCRRGIAFLFTSFIRNNAKLLSFGCHVIEAGRNAGSADINLRGSSGYGNRMSGIKPLRFDFNTFFSKEALIHSDK